VPCCVSEVVVGVGVGFRHLCGSSCGSTKGQLLLVFVAMAGEKAKTIPNSVKFLFGGLAG
jgi:hypothetical protein